MRWPQLTAAAATTLAAVLAVPAGVSGAPARSSGTLQVNATIVQEWLMTGEACPPGTPAVADCIRSVGRGTVPGLGTVTVTYDKILPRDSDPSCFILHHNTAVIEVAGKGTLQLSREGKDCGPGPPPRQDGPLEFTVASGSGKYAGASGSLVYRSSVTMRLGPCCTGTARDTWTGTLTVPGVDFDVAPPVLTGAVSKSVRAPSGARRVRVRYVVTAADAVDGAVPVACKPRSGSSFAIGRTIVTCSATDSSGNSARRRFTVTVLRARR
jgi:hypothetical protein